MGSFCSKLCTVLGGLAVTSLLVSACASVPPQTELNPAPGDTTRPVVPREVETALTGQPVAAAVATVTAPYVVGAAIDRVSASRGETVTVVGWLASEATQTRLIDNNGYGPGLMRVIVVDQAGRPVFDSTAERRGRRRGGPVFIEPLEPGRAFPFARTFSLQNPGQYLVTVRSGFRAQRPGVPGGEMTPETTSNHAVTTPAITVIVR